jgi:peroxiredoxin
MFRTRGGVMKKKSIVIAVMIVVVVSVVWSLLAFSGSAEPTKPGTKVPSFTLKDVEGKDHSLDEYLKAKYAVIMFIATQCPVSNAYNERMVQLQNDYASKGITFVAINSNKQESVDEVKEHSNKHGFKFPVLKDVNNLIADAYGAQVTPEIFVVDGKGILHYHGRIDDNRDLDEITSQDLRVALDALVAGKEVPRAETKAFGCTIKRVKK